MTFCWTRTVWTIKRNARTTRSAPTVGVKWSNSLAGFGIVNLEWAGKEILASLKEHRIWCLDLGAMRLGGRGFVAECGAGAEELAKIRILWYIRYVEWRTPTRWVAKLVKKNTLRTRQKSQGAVFLFIAHNSKLAKQWIMWYIRCTNKKVLESHFLPRKV